ncbi:hypothetical protein VB740_13560 [Nostoc sp. UHCC 0251]|nr:hypothetical protein [Nostoc sp. UHCC 0251]
MPANDTSIEKRDTEPITTPLARNRAIPMPINTHPNTSRLRGKGEREKGKEKTFNPYPLPFTPNPIPS